LTQRYAIEEFCSQRCTKRDWAKKNKKPKKDRDPKECRWCKVTFVPSKNYPKQEICSRECRNRLTTAKRSELKKQARESKACLTCGKALIATRKDKKFCSHRCLSSTILAIEEDKKARKQSREDMKCQNCGIKIESGRKQNCCSKKCRDAWYRTVHITEIQQKKAERYDNGGFILNEIRSKNRYDKLRQEPEKFETERIRSRKSSSRSNAKRKAESEALKLYLSSPEYRARVDATNARARANRTPEEIAADEKRDEERELKAWRKEYREGIKRQIAAKEAELAAEQAAIEATKTVTQDPTWADLEWSPNNDDDTEV
jgi:hypothetical protein